MMWIWLVLLYGVIKGIREIVKKKALQKNTTIEVLFLYTLLAFVIVLPDAKNAMGLETKYFFFHRVEIIRYFSGMDIQFQSD